MIKRFMEVEGRLLVPIAGQERLAYTLSGSTDLFELEEMAEHGDDEGRRGREKD